MQTLKHSFNKLSYKVILAAASFFLLLNVVIAVPVAAASPCDKKTPTSQSLENCLNENPIVKQLKNVINFLSAGVGIIVVGSIIVGGIQYALAGNNPQAVSAAKKRIQDTLIALLAFFFIYAFLQWLVPGGLLNGIL
jgi:uncharacterized membrane protein YraQ (UPF0718 family)